MKFGDVHRARIVRNTYNGESRGFGFVEMKTEDGTDRVSASGLSTMQHEACNAAAGQPHQCVIAALSFTSR